MSKQQEDVHETLALLEAIANQAATVYGGRDWHKLSSKERELVDLLEKSGRLAPSSSGGFVGKARS